MKIRIYKYDQNIGGLFLVPFESGFRFVGDISSDPSAAIWDVPEMVSLLEIDVGVDLPVSIRSLKTNMYIGVGLPLRVDGIDSSYYYANAYTKISGLALEGAGPVVGSSVAAIIKARSAQFKLTGGDLTTLDHSFVFRVSDNQAPAPEFGDNLLLYEVK